jgi:Tfp pilus assembly protein PilF
MKDPRKATIPANEEGSSAAASVWCQMGRDSIAEGEISEALWHLRQAVENDSDYITAWQLLGRCFEEMGEEARAQRCFRLAFRLSAKDAGLSRPRKSPAVPTVTPPREPRDA